MPDWIEWHGGERPVPVDALVDVRFGDGGVPLDAHPAASLNWFLQAPNPLCIVAYRVVGTVGQQPETQDDYEQTEAFDRPKPTPMSALARQEGGGHYKDFAIQPVEFITRNNIGFLEGCVIKRMTRHGAKNKAEDLRKAIHEIELLLELEYGERR